MAKAPGRARPEQATNLDNHNINLPDFCAHGKWRVNWAGRTQIDYHENVNIENQL